MRIIFYTLIKIVVAVEATCNEKIKLKQIERNTELYIFKRFVFSSVKY